MPLIPALRRQRQEDLGEFKDRLINKVSSSTARTTQRNFVLEKKKNQKTKDNSNLKLL